MATDKSAIVGAIGMTVLGGIVGQSLLLAAPLAVGVAIWDILSSQHKDQANLINALKKTELRLSANQPYKADKFFDLSNDDRSLLQQAVKEYFQHPAGPTLKNELVRLVSQKFDDLPSEFIQMIVDSYVKTLTEELLLVDETFRKNVVGLANLRQMDLTEEMVDLLRKIAQNQLIEKESKESASPAATISIYATEPDGAIDTNNFIDREKESGEFPVALSQHKLIVIVGTGGAGKSALAAKIYYQIGNKEIQTNIKRMTWINCRQINDQSQLLIDTKLSHLLVKDGVDNLPNRWNDKTISLLERYQALFEEFQKNEYLVCFDNLESFQDENGGLIGEDFRLFFEMLFTQRNQLHVIATTQNAPRFDFMYTQLPKLVKLEGLSTNDAITLIQRYFLDGRDRLGDENLEKVVGEMFLGYPFYVRRLAAWMQDNPTSDIDEYLTSPDQAQKELLEKTLERRNLAQKLVLTALSIFERAESKKAIEFLIGEYSAEWAKALGALVRDGFLIEGYRSIIDENGVDEKIKTFGLHGFDRMYIYQNWMLGEKYPPKEHFHQRAAEYYDEEVSHYKPGEYKNWYRLEDQDWQDSFLEWLSQLRLSNNLPGARLSIATKYFNAFWWWGCYLEFPFCEQIIDFTEKTTGFGDDPVVNLIKEFHRVCPRERDYKASHTKRWQKVKSLLLKLRQELGCSGDLAELQGDEEDGEKKLYLRAAIDAYLGDATYYVDSKDVALSFYESAVIAARDLLEEDWIASYLLCYRADRHIEKGDYEIGKEDIFAAWSLAEPDDPEIKARFFRLLGDIYWGQKEYEQAWKAYQLMIFYAYQFQGEPHIPDPYTVLFYEEMLERINDHFDVGYRLDPALTLSVCQTMRNFWKVYWLDAEKEPAAFDKQVFLDWLSNCEWDAINTYLFPDVPEAHNISYGEHSRFVSKKMARTVNKLQDELGIERK